MRAWKTGIKIAGSLPLFGMLACGAVADDKAIYAAQCASCHGDDGTAATPVGRALQIPAFKGSSFTRAGLEKLLSEDKNHVGLAAELGEEDLDALVETLNALAAAS